MKMVLAGAAVGLALAFVIVRAMNGLLFGVSARDPLTFAAVSAVLGIVALAASYLPARRAAMADPMKALRG
jgi:putative ABC transport system permease protein